MSEHEHERPGAGEPPQLDELPAGEIEHDEREEMLESERETSPDE